MAVSDPNSPPRDYVAAKNRREAIKKMTAEHPTLKSLYRAGTQDDGKAGWVNAIRDQREPVYRLLLYLDRMPISEEYRDREPFEMLFGQFADDQPNYQRALYTTTGGVNLLLGDLPDATFATALKTESLEIVPMSMDRDLKTVHLRERHYAYVCAFDENRQGLRVLNLEDYHEIFVLPDRQEIQVRSEEEIVVGDTRFVKPFFLKYGVKRATRDAVNPSDAARFLLDG